MILSQTEAWKKGILTPDNQKQATTPNESGGTTKGGTIMSVISITRENFQKEVIESNQSVLLDFWASWCGPCRMVSPVIDEIAGEMPEVKVGKINVDEQGELASAFHVMSIPTIVVMKNGKITAQAVGARPKSQILDML